MSTATTPPLFYEIIRGQCDLAVTYAEDGAYASAAQVLTDIATRVRQHAEWFAAQIAAEIGEAPPKPREARPLNHDLLERALVALYAETRSLVECCCDLQSVDGVTAPAPGTCDPDGVEEIEKSLELIRDIESELGRPAAAPKPDWLAELIDRRWPLVANGKGA